jgi:hypothetical protein
MVDATPAMQSAGSTHCVCGTVVANDESDNEERVDDDDDDDDDGSGNNNDDDDGDVTGAAVAVAVFTGGSYRGSNPSVVLVPNSPSVTGRETLPDHRRCIIVVTFDKALMLYLLQK